MSMLKEFREFALKGNLVDMAIAFVMGAAFSKVTSAFIDGMVMPLVGMIQGKDFSEIAYTLKEATIGPDGKETAAAVTVKYGAFITVAIEFIIVAFVMFMIIKMMNKMKKKNEEAPAPAAPPAPSKEELLLTEIRDALRNR